MHPLIWLGLLIISLLGASIFEELYYHYAILADLEAEEEQLEDEKTEVVRVRKFVMIDLHDEERRNA